jgi:aminoglycoside 3-N-acetyltransferase
MLTLGRIRELRARYGLRAGLARELRLQRNRILRRHEENSLSDDLRRLGVSTGDMVFVHTALSKVGHVVGGADTLIRAIMLSVGERGTVLMPSFSYGGLVLEYVRQNPVFDVRSTPCDLGVTPETFRRSYATGRSVHPTHSVCGWGREAQALLAEHERRVGPFGPGTPFVRFLERGGRGLIIGARVNNFTAMRAIEDIREDYPLPVYWPETFTLDVIDWVGRRFSVTTKVHNPVLGPYRNGDLLIPYFRQYGIIREGQVGEAPAYLIEGIRLLPILSELVDRGVLPFTISAPGYRRKHGNNPMHSASIGASGR